MREGPQTCDGSIFLTGTRAQRCSQSRGAMTGTTTKWGTRTPVSVYWLFLGAGRVNARGTSMLEIYYLIFIARQLYAQNSPNSMKIQYWPPLLCPPSPIGDRQCLTSFLPAVSSIPKGIERRVGHPKLDISIKYYEFLADKYRHLQPCYMLWMLWIIIS